jgi:hypothetical protein
MIPIVPLFNAARLICHGVSDLSNSVARSLSGDPDYDLKRAARQGNESAMFNLGNHAFNRGEEVAAMEWWNQAADRGHQFALVCLAMGYCCGSDRVKNLSIGIPKAKELAVRGFPEAQLISAYANRDGDNGIPNVVHAHAWFTIYLRLVSRARLLLEPPDATRRAVAELEAKLNPAEKSAAILIAQNWYRGISLETAARNRTFSYLPIVACITLVALIFALFIWLAPGSPSH